MSRLIYSMSVSLDGYITDRRGRFDWTEPDAELHRFHNEQVRELGGHLLGRRLYETMLYWETPEATEPGQPEVMVEFAQIWRDLPKVVFTETLESVEGGSRIAERSPADELATLRERSQGDLGIGGAGLASTFMQLDLIDEYRLFVYPVVLGGGTPFFAPVERRIELDLVEARVLGPQVTYQRYARRRGPAANP
ncbi:MAG: dihydrofolate reductase family protein [Thermoleophilia bacterium]|nr:dihydrofolate reductase family protein [Thermoleophilia bacterium]